MLKNVWVVEELVIGVEVVVIKVIMFYKCVFIFYYYWLVIDLSVKMFFMKYLLF